MLHNFNDIEKIFLNFGTILTDTCENVQKWTQVFSTRRWVILVVRTRRKKREKNSASTFYQIRLWASFESWPVSVKANSENELKTHAWISNFYNVIFFLFFPKFVANGWENSKTHSTILNEDLEHRWTLFSTNKKNFEKRCWRFLSFFSFLLIFS